MFNPRLNIYWTSIEQIVDKNRRKTDVITSQVMTYTGGSVSMLSLLGNVLFPAWEYIVPKAGIKIAADKRGLELCSRQTD
jgi:hypothetical protein